MKECTHQLLFVSSDFPFLLSAIIGEVIINLLVVVSFSYRLASDLFVACLRVMLPIFCQIRIVIITVRALDVIVISIRAHQFLCLRSFC